jgi:UDP-N-acetyl-D-glucosamine dehydrogenase
MKSQELTADYLTKHDCVLIATDHTADDWDFIIVCHARLVVDTRNATRAVKEHRERIYKA